MRRTLKLKPLVSVEVIMLLLMLLFITTALARTEQLVWGEAGVLEAVYNLPNWLVMPFQLITLFGSVWILAVLMVALFMFDRPKRALYLFLVVLVSEGLVSITKALVERPRPAGLLTNFVSRDVLVTGYGYPSGHTALATALAFSIYPWLPRRWRWIAPVWVILVALSRLYLGVHAPLDIIGGFIIGVLAAICIQITVVPENRKRVKTRIAKSRA